MEKDTKPEIIEPVSPGEWKNLLREACRRTFGETALPDRRRFSALEEWQCRVSGGALLKFLRFVGDRARRSHDEVLDEIGRKGKVLLCLTDAPGAVACHDILRMFRPSSLWLPTADWERISADPAVIADPELKSHFEYITRWSPTAAREAGGRPDDSEGTVWLHREGFRLTPQRSRFVVHHWHWDGRSLKLLKQGVPSEAPGKED